MFFKGALLASLWLATFLVKCDVTFFTLSTAINKKDMNKEDNLILGLTLGLILGTVLGKVLIWYFT